MIFFSYVRPRSTLITSHKTSFKSFFIKVSNIYFYSINEHLGTEDRSTEFKNGPYFIKNAFRENVAKYVCGFVNSQQNGQLLIGVNDDGMYLNIITLTLISTKARLFFYSFCWIKITFLKICFKNHIILFWNGGIDQWLSSKSHSPSNCLPLTVGLNITHDWIYFLRGSYSVSLQNVSGSSEQCMKEHLKSSSTSESWINWHMTFTVLVQLKTQQNTL